MWTNRYFAELLTIIDVYRLYCPTRLTLDLKPKFLRKKNWAKANFLLHKTIFKKGNSQKFCLEHYGSEMKTYLLYINFLKKHEISRILYMCNDTAAINETVI